MAIEDFNDLTIPELRALAEERGVEIPSGPKAAIVEALDAAESAYTFAAGGSLDIRTATASTGPCPFCGADEVKPYAGGDVNPHKAGREYCEACRRRVR